MSETWLILGATSSMARALTRKLAERGAGLLLAGRDRQDMRRTAADALVRGARSAEAIGFDAGKPEGFDKLVKRFTAEAGTLNIAVFVGVMPEQGAIDSDPALIDGVVAVNFTGPARLLHMLAPEFEARGGGTIVGVGSVAGDRGRLGNYVYGAAKAGFHTFLSGLRNRLARTGGHVVTVKPGFVDTSMTWGIDGMFLVASPEKVADDILKAVQKRQNVLYTPFFWRWIMWVIRAIPEPIFKKLSI